jgi:hypothetical protein
VNTQYEYQLTLELDDFEPNVFANAINTNPGRMERLQVMGLFKRPINYPTAVNCLAVSWSYFKTGIFNQPADAGAEVHLRQEVRKYVVEDGVLPAPNTFKKIRVPGDYPVFYRKGDAEETTEPEYTLGGGANGAQLNRYAVEQRFWNANPAMGKIPLLATVKRRVKGTTGAFAAAPANIKVYFQLIKPDDPPNFTPYAGSKIVAGARSYVSSVAAPPLRTTNTVKSQSQSPKAPKGKPGPAGYLNRQVRKYPDEVRSSDPQQCNAHFHLGGKFQMSANPKDLSTPQTAGPNTRANIFAHSPSHGALHALNLTNKKERALHRYSVWVETDANGKCGVLFQPSRIGGDRYKLCAYVYENAKYYKVETGTMVVWRTVRVCADIIADGAVAGGDLAPELTTGLSPFYGHCTHSNENQYCVACLTREGQVPPVRFTDYFTTELAKAHCELLLEPRAETPVFVTSAAIRNDITTYLLPGIQNNAAVNKLRFNEGELLALGDGVTLNYVNLQTKLKNFEHGTVKLTINGQDVYDDGAGNFPAAPAINLTGGAVDYVNGRISLTFAVPIPADRRISVVYTALTQINFAELLYFPAKSPWLFNLRTPEDYNTQVAGTAFPPIPVQSSITKVLGVPNGVLDRFTGNVFPVGGSSASNIRLFLGDTEIGWDQNASCSFNQTGAVKFFSKIDYLSGAVTVVRRNEFTENVGTGDGHTTRFDYTPVHPILKALAGSSDATLTIKVATKSVGTLVAHDLLRFPAAPLAGGAVSVNTVTNTVRIDFATAPDNAAPIEIVYSSATPFTGNDPLQVKCVVQLADVRSVVGLNSRVLPSAPYIGAITDLVDNALNMALGRAISNNQGYMPGLICLRAPSRDTWTSLYKNVTVEGKGICHAFLMFVGTASAATGRNPYETIAFHECCHSLYFQHYDSGSAAGPRSDLHDMWDNCLMGYARSERDLCGQCIANYMGLNVNDPRLRTWSSNGGIAFLQPDNGRLALPITG